MWENLLYGKGERRCSRRVRLVASGKRLLLLPGLLPSEQTLDGAGRAGGFDLGVLKSMDSEAIDGLEDGSAARDGVLLTITF
jgi:hypothetical protein